MSRSVGAVLVAVVLLLNGCGHDTKRDAVADAGSSLSRVQRGSMHIKLALGAGNGDEAAAVGFTMDGQFDLSPPGAELPEADLTTAKLGTPVQPPVRFLSTGHEAFIVQADVGYQLTADQVAPLRLQSGKGTGFSGVDLRGWAIDASSQPATTTPAGEVVDRVTGRVDPVAALNGIVALASQLGGGPDSALSIAASDADRVHAATQASSLELLVGRDDHVLRALTARVEFAAPQTQSTGGAVVQALSKFGHLTLTIELRIDHPNDQVTITRPARVRPIAEFPRS